MSRLVRALAVIVILACWLGGARPAAAAPVEQAAVSLLAQTASVTASGDWNLRLGIQAPDPSADRLEVLVFGQLTTRSAFDSAVGGKIDGYSAFHPSVALSSLAEDPAGGVDVTLPVNRTAAAGQLPDFSVFSGSGVYPVQLEVIDASGRSLSAPVTTFLVFDDGTNTFPPLSVALVVPVSAPLTASPAGQVRVPSTAEASRLESLASVLNADSAVPLSILADPLLLAALHEGSTEGSATDQAVLANLGGAPQGSLEQILPSPYSPVRIGDLVSAKLGSEVPPQLSAGADELAAVFGTRPSARDWVDDSTMDAPTAGALAGAGYNALVLPDSAVTPLPSPPETTFAQKTDLEAGGSRFDLITADSGISADFVRPLPAVLAANDLLAELAMIQTETPGVANRVVVAMPPSSWTVDPQFISTLIDGLPADRLLKAVTVSSAIDTATVAKGDPVRYLKPSVGSSAAESALAAASSQILTARQDVEALGALFPDRPDQLSDLPTELLEAESADLDPAQRSALLHFIDRAASRLTGAISLPPATSITLTARRGSLPITILSTSSLRPRVQLTLTSQRLIFEPFRPAFGSCTVPTPTREVCTFTLGTQNTTVHVPVETRSSGVFPLSVDLGAPGATRPLISERDTVRSTAVSGVGVVLIILAGLSLALWWFRDLRRGRRPKTMIRSPLSEPPVIACDDGASALQRRT